MSFIQTAATVGVSIVAAGLLLGACSSSTNVGVADAGVEGSTTSQNEGGASAEGGPLPPGTVLDGGSSATEAPGGDTDTIPCGSVSCPISSAICCAYPPANGATSFSYLCVAGTICPAANAADAGADGGVPEATALGCTGTANCANGNVCCVRPNDLNQGPQAHISECRGTCDSDDAQLCDPAAAMTGCTAAAPCSSANATSWGVPATFATCGGVKAM